jgi:serine phosphatase RsbU (regulator of sigma subunit)
MYWSRFLTEEIIDSVLRPISTRCGPVRVEARHVAGAQVGGDLYDVVHTPFGVRAIIGDVSGHGFPAARVATEVVRGFRELAMHETAITGIAFRVDGFVATADERFVTALIVQFDPDGSSAELVSCGHPAPILLRQGRSAATFDLEPALPLGLQELDDGWYGSTWLPLSTGDALLLYTDGFLAARDRAGSPYPLADRAADHTAADPGDFLRNLEADLVDYAGGAVRDDLALLYLRPEMMWAANSAPPAQMPVLGPEWPERGI